MFLEGDSHGSLILAYGVFKTKFVNGFIKSFPKPVLSVIFRFTFHIIFYLLLYDWGHCGRVLKGRGSPVDIAMLVVELDRRA